MTTPSEESMKSIEKYRRFIRNNFGIQGFSDEEYGAWLERSTNSDPGADPNNPWIVREIKNEH